jgi:hypothetical protein
MPELQKVYLVSFLFRTMDPAMSRYAREIIGHNSDDDDPPQVFEVPTIMNEHEKANLTRVLSEYVDLGFVEHLTVELTEDRGIKNAEQILQYVHDLLGHRLGDVHHGPVTHRCPGCGREWEYFTLNLAADLSTRVIGEELPAGCPRCGEICCAIG